jgi:hypothetical protein
VRGVNGPHRLEQLIGTDSASSLVRIFIVVPQHEREHPSSPYLIFVGSCVVPLSYDALTEVEIAEQSLPTEVTIAEFLASISDPEYEFGRRIYAKDWHFALAVRKSGS